MNAGDFRTGVMLAVPALSIGWVCSVRSLDFALVRELLPYCFVVLVVQIVLSPLHKRFVIMSVTAETSGNIVCVASFLLAISIAWFVAKPPFPPMLAVSTFPVCGIACYLILPFSRLLIGTLGVVIGKVVTLVAVALVSPFLFGLTLFFVAGGRNSRLAAKNASLTLGTTDPATSLMALMFVPMIAACLGASLQAFRVNFGRNRPPTDQTR